MKTKTKILIGGTLVGVVLLFIFARKIANAPKTKDANFSFIVDDPVAVIALLEHTATPKTIYKKPPTM